MRPRSRVLALVPLLVLGGCDAARDRVDGGLDASSADAPLDTPAPPLDTPARDTSGTMDVGRDATVPAALFVTITSPRDAVVTGPSTDVRWLASPGVTSTVCTLDGVELPCTDGGVALAGLASGERAFTVDVFDDVGGSASDAVLFNVDAGPPIVSALSAMVVAPGEVRVSWALVDVSDVVAVVCRFDGVDADCGAGASGVRTYSGLASGAHVAEVFGTDAWGNTGAGASPGPAPSPRAVVVLSVP